MFKPSFNFIFENAVPGVALVVLTLVQMPRLPLRRRLAVTVEIPLRTMAGFVHVQHMHVSRKCLRGLRKTSVEGTWKGAGSVRQQSAGVQQRGGRGGRCAGGPVSSRLG